MQSPEKCLTHSKCFSCQLLLLPKLLSMVIIFIFFNPSLPLTSVAPCSHFLSNTFSHSPLQTLYLSLSLSLSLPLLFKFSYYFLQGRLFVSFFEPSETHKSHTSEYQVHANMVFHDRLFS